MPNKRPRPRKQQRSDRFRPKPAGELKVENERGDVREGGEGEERDAVRGVHFGELERDGGEEELGYVEA